jgi:glutathione reductase (NADPH)
MNRDYDLVVVGTGAGGSTAAYKCRSAGWRVAVIDALPFGGTCALRGCDPKKVLVGAADLIDWNRRMAPNGIAGTLGIDWPALMRFKRGFTDPVPKQREQALRDAGIDVFPGRVGFETPDSLRVGDNIFRARHAPSVTGRAPLPGEGHIIHSDRFLKLGTLPRRILVCRRRLHFLRIRSPRRAGGGLRFAQPRAALAFKRCDLALNQRKALHLALKLRLQLHGQGASVPQGEDLEPQARGALDPHPDALHHQ